MLIKAPINLELTQLSGQTSQAPWIRSNDIFKELVIVDGKPILFKVSQDKKGINFDYELPLNKDFKINDSLAIKKVNEIFNLDFNIKKFYKFLNNDDILNQLTTFSNGLRLFIAKNKMECVISSISSANNSIARWTNSIKSMKEKFGNSYCFPSGTFYDFPLISSIKNLYIDEIEEFESNNVLLDINNCNKNLKSCGFGYRSKYIKNACELFTLEMDLQDIGEMSYDEAFDTILKVPGVGPKVADCILLYGYNFNEAFPTDVWIKRIISYLYFDNKDIPIEKVREFGIDKFGKYAGYIQLYLFHYARSSGLIEKLKK